MGLELGYPDLGIVPVPPDILPRGLFVEEPVAGPPDILGVRQKPDLGFIDIEPEGFLSSIFDYADTLDEMIENIRPDKSDETDSFDIAEIEEE